MKKKMMTYNEAKAFLKNKDLKTKEDYYHWWEANHQQLALQGIHLPSNPEEYYKVAGLVDKLYPRIKRKVDEDDPLLVLNKGMSEDEYYDLLIDMHGEYDYSLVNRVSGLIYRIVNQQPTFGFDEIGEAVVERIEELEKES